MRTLLTVALAGLLSACGGSDQAGVRSSTGGEAAGSNPTAEAGLLGREIFDLVDRAMSYRSSHRGRLPRNLRELGIDELTSSTSRALTASGNVPTVTVSFRNTSGRSLASCRGTNAVLEEAALSGGEFSLICTLVQGGSTTLRAQR